MPHFCEFCQIEHTSMSCFHPARQQLECNIDLLKQVQAERDTLLSEHGVMLSALRLISGGAEAEMRAGKSNCDDFALWVMERADEAKDSVSGRQP